MNCIYGDKSIQCTFSNGMRILPFYRTNIRDAAINYSGDTQWTSVKTRKISKIDILKSLLKNIGMVRIFKCKYLYFSNTVFNVKDENGGYFNSLDGYYYMLKPNESCIIEGHDENYKWRTKSSYRGLSFIDEYYQFIANVLGKFSLKLKACNNPDLEIFHQEHPQYSLKNLQRTDRMVYIYARLIRRLLKKSGCKVVFLNCGCYGSYHAIVSYVAKSLGIRVVELQHGMINKGHIAYGEDTELKNDNDYKQYLPDEVWTFGEYWSKQVDWDIKKIAIGNPYLNSFKTRFATINPKNKFLIISQHLYQHVFKTFVPQLAECYPNETIILRLHPRDNAEDYSNLLETYKNIRLSSSEVNLYQEICQSEYVIGIDSTCLYESVAFGKVPVIIDCEQSRRNFNHDIGVWVKTPKQIMECVQSQNTDIINQLWADDFDNNALKELNKY